ncbi:hypothetical protein ACNO8X_08275 [Mycobacterium sp. PDNC021]|uniref:hypothetical protein n=1 Tax=Mycobacterium sp. PDNC021 TaxID=3391399 RepID=UPI003AB0AB86
MTNRPLPQQEPAATRTAAARDRPIPQWEPVDNGWSWRRLVGEASRQRWREPQLRQWYRPLAQVSALAAAAVAVVATAPVPLRVLALAALVLIPGTAAVHLLFSSPGGSPRAERRPRAPLADPAIRLPLTVVFGVVELLAVVLVVNVAGLTIDGRSVALGTALLGAVLVVTVAAVADRTTDMTSGVSLFRARLPALGQKTAAAMAAVIVLGGGLAGAIALQPKNTETYTTLTFLDPSWLSAAEQSATAGAPVRINWELRAFGYRPDARTIGVTVRIDGVDNPDLALDIRLLTDAAGTGQSTDFYGAVTFPAPVAPGRHLVQLLVQPYPRESFAARDPVMLTGFLRVRSR